MNATRRQLLAGSLRSLASAVLWRRNAGAAPAKLQPFSQYDPQVRPLLQEMTLDEKVGQMTQPDQQFLKDPGDIDKYHFGSLLSGGDSDPKSGNDLNSWTDLYDHFQACALKTRLRIPLLYGIDAVHGHNNVLGAVIFPHNIGLGCTRNPELVEKASRITAEEVRATGINWAFAPCVTVPQDIRWGRTYEGFSELPDVVRALGAAAVRGFQGRSLNHPLSVAACAKHFAGDGGTTFGTGMRKGGISNARYPLDRGDARMDEPALRRVHLAGYVSAIEMAVGSIMPSYSSWNGVKCSGNTRLLTNILKKDLGFEGFLISDYGALSELPGGYKQQIETSINAGMDMVMVPDKYPEFFNNLRELVKEGKVAMSRIDDAVTRILRVKVAMGMMSPERSQRADRNLHKSFGSAEHRAVARQCVRESLVLLKNQRRTLPLAKNARRIHVAGRSADDIGNQCGGWTITWQGKSGSVTSGTTILAAIRQAASKGAEVTYSRDGTGAAGATVGIAVIGETPYAEFSGDRTELNVAAEDVAVVEKMKNAGIPVVVVLVSGRPLVADNLIGRADAFLAAWLPGSEGAGVADVLFGDYKPAGKLSFTWPASGSTSFARSDAGYKTLFPAGFGLSY